ncbi:TetR/AcrR family transcriptional repressor of nem operon [Aquimarina sp. EL_43]|uniref:TetR/AcrR family transcriptional regulator n=1 Tax=Aquimarina TaxID=290174 RepID=UPI00046EE436|nr:MULTISPECIES: TetR/AcrR family transcriptional regulator [Aquimarina]MBG6129860.1 TetR/AcrR family transcriptional repressor of nem operon [Aquimarina sp. EL_35]MBG6150925.1 TetR/AcrR family transcriptional repressor of nem operon [Aquimarina sp. EL_32]MBG6167768.1 TetR/AcrR family transcriptional repressor of nem operon [Aquimarina sp. EL_43]
MPKVETFNRNTVLQKATEVFHKKGYNGTSMQDLVDATDLNRSSIYNSFGSKLNMFLEVLSHYQSIYGNSFSQKLAQSYNATEAIEAIFDLYIHEIINDNDRKGCLVINCKSEMTNQEPLIKSFMEKNQDRMIAMLEDIVTKGQMEKIFNQNQTAGQYALYLFSSIQGLRMTGILNKNENDLRNLTRTVLKVLY